MVLAWKVNWPGKWPLDLLRTGKPQRAEQGTGSGGECGQSFSSRQSKSDGTKDAKREEMSLATEQLLSASVALSFSGDKIIIKDYRLPLYSISHS